MPYTGTLSIGEDIPSIPDPTKYHNSIGEDIPSIPDPTKYHNSMYRNGTATHACLAWCML
jgi:hypothetical protein